MQAKDLIKWKEISLVLSGNPNTVRSDRPNTKHSEKIEALLDYVQDWIDKKGNVGEVKVTIKAPVKCETSDLESEEVEIPEPVQVKKQDYVSVDSLPKDRKLMSEDGYRGLYSSGKKFYTNKVKSGGLDIREWSKLSKAKEYLDNLK